MPGSCWVHDGVLFRAQLRLGEACYPATDLFMQIQMSFLLLLVVLAAASASDTCWLGHRIASRQGMKAVFLDIDGVMLPFGCEPGDESAPGRFPYRCLQALDRILSETDAELVLSSTWRCAGGASAILEQFSTFSAREEGTGRQSALEGVAARGMFEHMTDPAMHSHRQWEIAHWIETAEARGVQIEGWCALDDEELVSLDPEEGGGDFNARYKELFMGRHVKTISSIGLTDELAGDAISALNRPYTPASSASTARGDKMDKDRRIGKGKRGQQGDAAVRR